jgi:hypothetical protein
MCQHCQKPNDADGVCIDPLTDPRRYGLNFLPKDELIDIIINLQNEREAADRATSWSVIGIVVAVVVIVVSSVVGKY